MKYNICEEHGDTTIVFFNWGLSCPLCDMEKKINELEEKIDDMEKEV